MKTKRRVENRLCQDLRKKKGSTFWMILVLLQLELFLVYEWFGIDSVPASSESFLFFLLLLALWVLL